MTDVAVVGSLNMDFTVHAERLPQLGETVIASSFASAPGGKGSNQCVAAARQGADTAMIGAVGDDSLGRELRQVLVTEGVEAQHVTVVDGVSSGVALITVDRSGDNTIAVAPQANQRLLPGHVEAAAEVIGDAGVVLCQLEVPLDTVEIALALGRRSNTRTLLNPAPAAVLPDRLLGLVDLILPNETEAESLTGVAVASTATAVEAADTLLARGCGAVVVTLGEKGALYHDGERTIEIPPLPVEAVDATAAGDAFCGALAAALAGDTDLEPALRQASAAGALTVTRHGAQPSLPTADETTALLLDTQVPGPSGTSSP